MMTVQERISQWVDAHEAELIRDIGRLVAVRSVRGEAEPDAPFGPGPRASLDEALALCSEYGFATEIYGCAVGTADLNDKPSRLDILGHLDVVVEGDGWDTPPYEAVLKGDGCLYGRGTDDDKGPVLAALMAMRAVKDLGFSLKKNVRLIAGTDEETDFRDIHWYYERHPYAPHTLSPDADFPIINIEKGHYQPTFRAAWPQEAALPRVSSFTGGPRLNMVPPKAQATVLGLTAEQVNAAIAALGMEAAISYTVAPAEGGVRIQASGQNAHGSTPEEGHNAQTALLTLLAALPLADCPSTQAIQNLVRLFPHGDHIGQALGVAQSDDLSGGLSLAFTMLTLTDTGCEGRFDSRTPLCGTDATVRLPAEAALQAAGFTVEGEIDPPHHVPATDPFLQTLACAYELYSGRESHCIAIGGGTYVHGIPGGVAFGASMPGFVSNLHGPDEHVNVADLLTAAMIYTQVILDVCGE